MLENGLIHIAFTDKLIYNNKQVILIQVLVEMSS